MTTNRFSLMIAFSVIALLAVLSISMGTAPHRILSNGAYERLESARQVRDLAAVAQQAYLAQRQGEYAAGASDTAAAAYLQQREGEWKAGVNIGLLRLQFRHGEWFGN